jgi:acyl-CoA reductase-like NAD-dependent aldehyde dehydrogenase
MQRFRAALVAQIDTLAATMTAETGKPIALSRNELNGLLPRIDFFMEEAESAVRDEHVFDGGGMHEQIGHIPLGVVPTSRPGTTPTSWAATSSCRRC